MDPASGVIVAQTAAGTSVVLGLMRCGRIWLCPVCAATIRHKRAEEITAAVVEWIKRGGTA
ncbi:replication protein, partial [Streptomyces sp. NPDC059990]